MNHIELVKNKGFAWYSEKNVHVKGFIFDKDGNYLHDNLLIQYFSQINSEKTFEDTLKQSNGLFSVIIETNSGIFAAVDIIRSLPLFYSKNSNEFFITDEIDIIIKSLQLPTLNERNIAEFLSTGYVTGSETLVEQVHQLIAGEYIYFNNAICKRKYYYNYAVSSIFHKNFTDLSIEGKTIFNATFKRLIDSLNGKTAVVPLSGGFDSRMIVTMLKHYNYKNVLCYTYGRKNNKEIEISHQVANALGYKWIYIEYKHELIDGYINENVFSEYYKYTSNYSSMFFMQEYFAVKYLKENSLIPPDSVFIPGHSGDFLGGSQLTKFNIKEDFSSSEIPEKILQTKFDSVNINNKNKKLFKKKILTEINELFKENAEFLPYSVFEDWDCKEKLSKFIANSANVYNFFGYQHRLPYWDSAITEFFKNVPYQYKWNKLLYDSILKEYFAEFGINFNNELQPSLFEMKKQIFKNKIKSFIPLRIKYLLSNKNDNYFYIEITSYMVKEIIANDKKIYQKYSLGNSKTLQWFIYKLRKDERFSNFTNSVKIQEK
jgi:asparagine synthase (glutamine-hydrolysing)